MTPKDGALTLAQARDRAETYRRMLATSVDPKSGRAVPVNKPVALVAPAITAPTAADASSPTFGAFADEHLDDIVAVFKNPKHAAQWKRDLEVTAEPLRGKRIRDITPADVVRLVAPIMRATPESGRRLVQRIERVMGMARAMGHYSGLNPAQWKGNLQMLPALDVERVVTNQESIPYYQMPIFMGSLRLKSDVSALALDFCILTAARTNEVLGARWDEIDSDMWTVPPERMKKKREHKVPLSADATAIVDKLRRINGNREFIFANPLRGTRMSDMAMLQMLRGLREHSEIVGTVHGFRATFSTWSNEQKSEDGKPKYDRGAVDFCLSHINKDRVEAAYNRAEVLDARRVILADWAEFLKSKSSK
jgi:integrase